MKLVPERSSQSLLKIIGTYSSILYVVLLFAHAVLRSQFTLRAILGLASLALVAAVVAGLGFWLEGRMFFLIYSASLGAGVLYTFWVVIGNATPGWGELTSLVGFMLIAASGMVAGLGAEFVRYLVKPRIKPKLREH